MGTRTITVRRSVCHGILAAVTSALWIAPAWAQTTSPDTKNETHVHRLGGTTRFSQPMRTSADVHAMASANRDQITHVLTLAGLGDMSSQVVDAMTVGEMSDVTITPGTHLYWMAL